MEHPIVNPPNPYVGTLRVFPGTLVKIAGRPRPNATRFAINFQTGPSLNPRDDLALHLSPCFTPPRVIRNSLQNGNWGLEESWGNGSILTPHQSFEIIILAEPDQFKIAINGAHYCEFRHRIPYQQITNLTIDGDVDIERISVTTTSYSQQQPQHSAPYQPSVPSASATPYPPYPTGASANMPMPPMYPTLVPSGPAAHYPSVPSGPPAPTPSAYGSGGYPPAGPYPTPSSAGGAYPQAQGPPHMGGPAPAGSGYQGGYPQQQPGHSSASSPFGSLPLGNKALGTLAGLGLGAAAGAAVLSAANPLKHVKKIMKPKKMFKHKGWGHRSSSSSSSNSSRSSRGSFSSNSS